MGPKVPTPASHAALCTGIPASWLLLTLDCLCLEATPPSLPSISMALALHAAICNILRRKQDIRPSSSSDHQRPEHPLWPEPSAPSLWARHGHSVCISLKHRAPIAAGKPADSP